MFFLSLYPQSTPKIPKNTQKSELEPLIKDAFSLELLGSDRITTKMKKNVWLMTVYTYIKDRNICPNVLLNNICKIYEKKDQFGGKCDIETLQQIHLFLINENPTS